MQRLGRKGRGVGEQPRQRVPKLRQRQRDPRVDLARGEEQQQREREHAADERPQCFSSDARREFPADGRDDVKRLRAQFHERRGDLDQDGVSMRGRVGHAAEEEAGHDDGDEGSRRQRESRGGSEFER